MMLTPELTNHDSSIPDTANEETDFRLINDMPPFAFQQEAFPQHDYSVPAFFCSLQNDNLFTIDKLIFLREIEPDTAAIVYKSIEPALKLVSRILLNMPELFASILDCQPVSSTNDGSEACTMFQAEITLRFRDALPDLNIGSDTYVRGEAIGFTNLLPDEPRDVIVVDENLVMIPYSGVRDVQKNAALVMLAVLIGRGLVNSVRFRSLFHGNFNENKNLHEVAATAAAKITQEGAGTSWEHRVLGGRIRPVCDKYEDLSTLRGLAIESLASNFDWMKLEGHWLPLLFREDHWQTAIPLQAPSSYIAQHPLIHDPLRDDTMVYDVFVKRRLKCADIKLNYFPTTKLRTKRNDDYLRKAFWKLHHQYTRPKGVF